MMAEPESSLQTCSACGSPLDVADYEPLSEVECPVCGEPVKVGRFTGEFELLEVVGRGGMGVVYRAQDTRLDRFVALKVLRTDSAPDGFLSELEAEAAVTASINHPHVVRVYTTGIANGRFYLAMELVDKGTLDDLMTLQGRIAETQALEIALQIAQGLRAAHQHGLIHRDVKPGNILFSDAHTAKIVDFGLAVMEEASKGSDEIWGTPYYVSPERLDQKPEDFRSDMYSLGATIFHAIAGRPPFEAENATMVALKHLKSQAVSLQAFAPWVSGSTAFVINRMLLKDPAARYGSYDELIEHLEYARDELATRSTQPKARQRVVLETAEDRKRAGYLAAVMVGIVVLILAGGGVLLYLKFRKGQGETLLSPAALSVGADAKTAPAYEEARKLLQSGSGAAAAERFHTLGIDKKTPEPMAQWCLAQEGLAWLVDGKPGPSREAFGQLGTRAFVGNDRAGQNIGAFFSQLATFGSDAGPVTATGLMGLEPNSYGAFAYLVAGLKTWELGEADRGELLMGQFLSAAPGAGYEWISDYRPLVLDYVSDFKDFHAAEALTANAKSAGELKNAVLALGKVREGLKRQDGPVAAKVQEATDRLNKALSQQLAAADAHLAGEKKALTTARDHAVAQAKDWRFAQARNEVTAVALSNPDLLREQRALVRKLDWLNRFRDTLIKDMAAGYTGPLQWQNGKTLPAGVAKATEEGVIMTGNPPPPPIPWPELAPESLLAASATFVTPNLPAWQAGYRRWTAGVFALLSDRKDDARTLLLDGAKGSAELADHLPLFFPPRRSDLARGKAVTSSGPTTPAASPDGPEHAVDGSPTSRWMSTAPGQKWLRVDLGQNATLVRWVCRHASSNGEPPETDTSDFSLQRSQDGETWQDVDKVRNNNQGVTDRRIPQTTAQFFRVIIDKPNRRTTNDPTARLYELELWGSTSVPDLAGDLFAAPTAASIPELTEQDISIGGTDPAGSTSVDDRTGIFTIRASGADIGTIYDAFRFAHRPCGGDAQIIVRVESVEYGNDSSKCGIMFREGTGGDSRMVFLGVHPGTHGVTWHARLEPKQNATSSHEASISAPCWLKIERKGNLFTGSASKDGKKWLKIGSATLAVPATLEAGLAATAHATGGNTVTAREEIILLGH